MVYLFFEKDLFTNFFCIIERYNVEALMK